MTLYNKKPILECKARDGESFWISEEDSDLLKFKWRMYKGYIVRSSWDANKGFTKMFDKKIGDYRILKGKGKIIKLHRVIAERMNILIPNSFVDHIDRNRANNARENLRPVTCGENTMNSNGRRDNKSGVRGVCFINQCKRWKAFFKGKKDKHFKTKEEAIICRKQWEQEYKFTYDSI